MTSKGYLGDYFKPIKNKSDLLDTPDHHFGFGHEESLENTIAKYFKTKLTKLPRFHKFDFITQEGVYIELKSRRFKHNHFNTTMVGLDKIQAINNQHNRYAIFIFNFTDGLYYYQYDSRKMNELHVKLGGRTDRGFIEEKDYAYIPISYLHKLDLNKPPTPTPEEELELIESLNIKDAKEILYAV